MKQYPRQAPDDGSNMEVDTLAHDRLASSSPPPTRSTHEPESSTGFFARPLYPMRLLGTATCIALGVIYVWNEKAFHLWYLLVLALALTYPHVSRIIAGRLERRRQLELRTSLIDAFIVGSTVYVVGFSHIPTVCLMTIALANGMALGGVSFMALSVLSVGLGMILPMAIYGLNYAPSELLALNMVAAAMLLVYFNMFALVAYRRSVLLQESRRFQREQRNLVEIEKKKSENLLRALLPAKVAEDLQSKKLVQTTRHEHATVLIAGIHDLSHVSSEMDPRRLLAEVNHCFRAFEQIVTRHGLEPLRTTVDSFTAVAGVPSATPHHALDAAAAALEMHEFIQQYNQARFAAAEPDIEFKVVIHSGTLFSGLIETRKFTFDVFGEAIEVALEMLRVARPGPPVASQATLKLVEDRVEARDCGRLIGPGGREIAQHTIRSRAGVGP